MGQKTSETHQTSTLIEDLFGWHHHYTHISDGDKSVCYHGNTTEEAERGASEMWDEQYGDDD